MPKEIKPAAPRTVPAAPYPVAPTSTTGIRNAAIWSAADDEILLQARASGLNWQPIANRHFPNKTANACRKRHERLIERRHVEDWDAEKLELLAHEYMICRREMWETLANRIGERWAVVEAKCLEKGLKTLQATARTAHRRASATSIQAPKQDEPGFQRQAGPVSDRGISDHNSDSGIGLDASDAEMEQQVEDFQSEHHVRPRSLPQPLPLYQPPPPISVTKEQKARHPEVHEDVVDNLQMTSSFHTASRHPARHDRYSPDSNARGSFSIQSVLSADTRQT
ncbi:hypothetical protein KC332_g17626 [Hortaea werneckii]|uniref:Myb-like domain-containing protein n=1 Tax=Hortaea werneckii EXF-2000 TaxID=1157616 RepID=A0A1Z5TKS5_HORWE|nr:hypothetical protein KC358_g16739 [Hortaea werneckii]OTA36634.1 hypothetical protein BTJ68_02927 [Hortaea werneckii EXF-2000]KAI6801175.1 hypothetical protein KC350_g15706 [Hortaea werneckii]KAI6829961.1 hypothetical protein KC342_g8713 [Hortaea werneckii]KAI6897556.1 hypothetical protein KC348_g17697 [Hortaea werneckii]